MKDTMKELEKFRSWYAKFAVASVVITTSIIIVFGYLTSTPSGRLFQPWLLFSAWLLASGALQYLGVWWRAKTEGDARLLFGTTAFIMVVGCCLAYYSAFQFGLIVSRPDLREQYITAIVGIPVVTLVLYFVKRSR